MPSRGHLQNQRWAYSALEERRHPVETSASQNSPLSAGPLLEFRKLLAPFVPSILHDSEGAVDVSKIPAKNFAEFRQFLADHAAINDDKWGRNPYAALFRQEKYRGLISSLFHQSHGIDVFVLPPARLESLLHAFRADLIAIDAHRFARDHMGGAEGRNALRHVLRDASHYSREIRADLSKAIARVAKEERRALAHEYDAVKLSTYNYFNVAVSESDVEAASKATEVILQSADFYDQSAIEKFEGRLEHPEQIADSRLLKSQGIGRDEVERMARLAHQEGFGADPIGQAMAQLAEIWLMAADDRLWTGAEWGKERDALRAYILKRAGGILGVAQEIRYQNTQVRAAGFVRLNEHLQSFLKGPAYLNGPALADTLLHWVKGNGLAERLAPMPGPYRQAFDRLTLLSDEWQVTMEMGEKIDLQTMHSEAPHEPALSSLIQALEATKYRLWYSYGQHSALVSKPMSWLGSRYDVGNIAKVKRANLSIDRSIERLRSASTGRQVETELQFLFEDLKDGGVLFEAMKAVEMDGTEALLAQIQTVGVTLAAGAATEGLGVLFGGGRAALQVTQATGTLSGSEMALAAARFSPVRQALTQGTSRGSQLFKSAAMASYSERAIAKISHQTGSEADDLYNWSVQAFSEGIATGLLGALPNMKALNGALARRAKSGTRFEPLHGLKVFSQHIVGEGVEELISNQLSHYGHGDADAQSLEEIQNSLWVVTASGAAKIRAALYGIKAISPQVAMESEAASAREIAHDSSSANGLEKLHVLKNPGIANPILGPAGISAGLGFMFSTQGIKDAHAGTMAHANPIVDLANRIFSADVWDYFVQVSAYYLVFQVLRFGYNVLNKLDKPPKPLKILPFPERISERTELTPELQKEWWRKIQHARMRDSLLLWRKEQKDSQADPLNIFEGATQFLGAEKNLQKMLLSYVLLEISEDPVRNAEVEAFTAAAVEATSKLSRSIVSVLVQEYADPKREKADDVKYAMEMEVAVSYELLKWVFENRVGLRDVQQLDQDIRTGKVKLNKRNPEAVAFDKNNVPVKWAFSATFERVEEDHSTRRDVAGYREAQGEEDIALPDSLFFAGSLENFLGVRQSTEGLELSAKLFEEEGKRNQEPQLVKERRLRVRNESSDLSSPTEGSTAELSDEERIYEETAAAEEQQGKGSQNRR